MSADRIESLGGYGEPEMSCVCNGIESSRWWPSREPEAAK